MQIDKTNRKYELYLVIKVKVEYAKYMRTGQNLITVSHQKAHIHTYILRQHTYTYVHTYILYIHTHINMEYRKSGNFVYENIHVLNICVNKFSRVPHENILT